MKDPYLHIEDYVKGNLSETDRLSFESAMSTDEQLKQSVEDFGLVDLIGEALIEEEIAGIVDEELGESELNTEAVKENSLSSIRILKWVVAASVILLLGLWGSSLFTSKSEAQLFAEVLVDPAWPAKRSGDENTIEYLTTLYREGYQSVAKDSLRALGTSESLYWLSELYTIEQQFDSTILYLELDLESDGKIRRDRKLYLHIVALYFSGDHFRAKTAFESLPDDVDEWYVRKLQLMGL